ncbi:family 43 glycosylhydrolase [Planobispora siamensis]|nr:family 43 glycosylhydrolase [Planobispora siamensis]
MSIEQSASRSAALPPAPVHSAVAVAPPAPGEGHWAGAPSAVAHDGRIYLAYRLRRPVGQGRGHTVVVARSADGERFETLLTITREEMDTESLERPALVRTPEGRWRLYLSCATTGTKHWRVEMIEADDPARFDSRSRTTVLPGDPKTGVKDPVIVRRDGVWHLWASCHPLADPDHTDRMVTDYATSADGLEWTWHGTALSGRPGAWDGRGVRISAVRFTDDGVLAFYDGRASAQENYEERTGIAVGADPADLTPQGDAPAAVSPHRGGGLRYLDIVDLPNGDVRLYYEYTRADGAHELRTELRRSA